MTFKTSSTSHLLFTGLTLRLLRQKRPVSQNMRPLHKNSIWNETVNSSDTRNELYLKFEAYLNRYRIQLPTRSKNRRITSGKMARWVHGVAFEGMVRSFCHRLLTLVLFHTCTTLFLQWKKHKRCDAVQFHSVKACADDAVRLLKAA